MYFWSIPATNGSVEGLDDILHWAVQTLSIASPPMIHSISYGMLEEKVDYYMGKGYLVASDLALARVAARGMTVIIADGDTGAGDLGAFCYCTIACQCLTFAYCCIFANR